MGDFYKTCDIHGKPFPNNQVDTRKTKLMKLKVQKTEEIESESVRLNLFVDKNADKDGVDVCSNCLQTKILDLMTATDNVPAWLVVEWNEVEKQKKDGSGTYKRNEMTKKDVDEITEEIRERKKQAPTPTAK